MARKAKTKPVDTQLFARYRPLPGVPDELVDAQGVMRPVWAGLLAHMSGLSDAEMKDAFARGEQHLADTGVFFRKYGDKSERGSGLAVLGGADPFARG